MLVAEIAVDNFPTVIRFMGNHVDNDQTGLSGINSLKCLYLEQNVLNSSCDIFYVIVIFKCRRGRCYKLWLLPIPFRTSIK